MLWEMESEATTKAFPRPTPVKYVNINNDQAVVQDTILDFLPEKVNIVASSNGLLCCHRSQELGERVDNLIYVCNPAKEYVQIQWSNGNDSHQYVALAFNPFRYPVDDLANFKVVSMSKEVVFASGVLYWLTNGNILGFDVETEQPCFISLPAGLRVWILDSESKWVVEHSISLLAIEEECPQFLYTDAKRAATLVPNNLLTPTWIEPLVYEDEILLIRLRYHFSFENEKLEEGTMIYLYNFDTRKMEELLNIDKLGSCNGFLNTVPYSMSLAPLGSA
ncbi:hypothetical protein IFM89_007007 [Coptis chinensis]|uniref:F-box protein n=1 Tax=Coptis chinensis TaxID=261450 RepID=A0A835M7N0_9MAGN|nr:hypothetical protein IFM89_007007 [Coptis chinensis]